MCEITTKISVLKARLKIEQDAETRDHLQVQLMGKVYDFFIDRSDRMNATMVKLENKLEAYHA